MVCLDTSFVIDLIRGKSSVESVVKKLDEESNTICIAAVTVMELVKGAYLSDNYSVEKEKIDRILSSFVILEFGKDEASLAGKIEVELIKKGGIIEIADIMIAATAIKNEEVLVTKNKKHFERIKELKIESY